MSDRLQDLQRQRALAQEQLDWLDREIARESGRPAAPPPPAARAVTPAAGPVPAPSAAEAARLADDIIAQYKNEAATSPADVKRGCFLYFAAAFALLILGVAALYFYSVAKH